MNSNLSDPALWSRIQFGFTLTYHHLFPQLTMGLAWFLVYWKWRALRTGDEKYNQAARFWAKIFGLNFAVGVVTGIPMEFQFGTNSAGFSRYAGGVIGQTLAMEGMFAFFLESAFIGALIRGEKRLGPRYHFLAALGVALGSWLSGFFILATNAFMQHPAGYQIESDGLLGIVSASAFIQFALDRPAGHRERSFLSRDALFDACAGEFINRVQRGRGFQVLASRIILVAHRLCAGDDLFRLHLPALYGESKCCAGQPRVLLNALRPASRRTNCILIAASGRRMPKWTNNRGPRGLKENEHENTDGANVA
jgi:Cytochrome bd terminal oxidase subunit I